MKKAKSLLVNISVVPALICLCWTQLLLAQADYSGPLLYEGVSIAGDQLVFSVGGNIYHSPRSGGDAVPMLRSVSDDRFPIMSPDGRQIAFMRLNSGGGDIFVHNIESDATRQLTFHPAFDQPLAFSPGGDKLLFTSLRDNRVAPRLYELDLNATWPRPVSVPFGVQGTYAADGQALFFTPTAAGSTSFRFYYRGGRMAQIHRLTLPNGAIEPVTAAEFNAYWPQIVGNRLVFAGDQNGLLNIYRRNLTTGETVQLTDFDTVGVGALSSDDRGLVFERDGQLFQMNWSGMEPRLIPINIKKDATLVKPYVANAAAYRERLQVSAGGDGVVTARGELFKFNLEDANATNVSRTPGVRERGGALNSDGQWLAFFDDASGEYQLVVQKLGGSKRESYAIEANPGFYEGLTWSPNSRYLAFSDHRLSLWLFDLEEKAFTRIARSNHSAQIDYPLAWSPGGRYLAYTKLGDNGVAQLHAYDTQTGESNAITQGRLYAANPQFDLNGDYLYFTLSPNRAAADYQWALQSGIENRAATRSRLYAVSLRETGALPYNQPAQLSNPQISRRHATTDASIDWAGIAQRIVLLPLELHGVDQLTAIAPGELIIANRRWPPNPVAGVEPGQRLYHFQLSNPERLVPIAPLPGKVHSARGGQVLLVDDGDRIRLLRRNGAQWNSEPYQLDALPLEVNPKLEWDQMYAESWRIIREHFYDPNLHGYDWQVLADHYKKFLPALSSRQEFTALLNRIRNHLSVSHTRVGLGELGFEAYEAPNVGLLGADFVVEAGRYKISRIFRGDTVGARAETVISPLSRPSAAGKYLIAVDGRPITAERNLYWYFRGTAERLVSLTFADTPDGANSTTVQIRALSSEARLRRLDWAEQRQRKVEAASGGNIAYLSLDSMSQDTFEDFYAGFYALGDKDGLIIDVRFNPGGITADSLINLLRRKAIYGYLFRNGNSLSVPAQAFHGPVALLVNQFDHSAAETFSFMFKLANIGPVIGQRTAGSVNGGYGYTTKLMDGGLLSYPNRGAFDPNRDFMPENHGVEPDHTVPLDIVQWRRGGDSQLDKALEMIGQPGAERAINAEHITIPNHVD